LLWDFVVKKREKIYSIERGNILEIIKKNNVKTAFLFFKKRMN